MANEKNVKYTAEEIEGWLQKMMGILQNMIDSREEWGRIGIIFAYAKETSRFPSDDGEKGTPLSADTIGGHVGDEYMAAVALDSFLDAKSDLTDLIQTIKTTGIKFFGLTKQMRYGK